MKSEIERLAAEEELAHTEYTHYLCQQWENIALKAEAQKVRVCLLRTGLVIGKNGGFLKRMLLPFKLGLGGRIGHGQQWMSWVHLDDLTDAIIWLLTHPTLSGPFNGTAPKPVTNSDFTKALGRCLKRPTIFTVPAVVLKLALGEMSRLLLTGQRVLPTKLLESGFEFKYSDVKSALQSTLN